ncbi:hypothetical protein B0T19DRAFT_477747 [Cercophora scortea]|uniref:Zn(2)-C6 fungal-type domain-containing protein n=1 Tax=Cercophora scortea TaxID=314031 RepID=A0AAE0I8C8_9PEZI|nr:hypothetical protein B0T19DRAFT_477747 [Cercophora scortea]
MPATNNSSAAINATPALPNKRPSPPAANDQPGAPATRSKRAKYSSIACEECRSRKLKCETSADSWACHRCISNGVTCNITRPHAHASQRGGDGDVEARFSKFEQELCLLRHQVAYLTSGLQKQIQDAGQQHEAHLAAGEPPSRSGSSIHIPAAKDVHEHVEPHFVGTTRPEFGLNMAKASLARMGVSPDDHDHGDTDHDHDHEPGFGARHGSPTQSLDRLHGQSIAMAVAAQQDPLLRISQQEARRLLAVFQDEVETVYPILHSAAANSGSELEARIPHIYECVGSRSQNPPCPGGGSVTPEQKQAQLLKVVLAMALVLEEHGRCELSEQLMRSVEDATTRLSAHSHVDLPEIRILTIASIYHFFRDDELYAWRVIGVAGRLVLEMGLHRRQSLLENFPDPDRRQEAVCLFWCVYVLDRRWSFGTSLSFALIDRDIDPELPQVPPTMPYLQSLVAYGRLSSKVWEALPQFNTAPSSHATCTIPAALAAQLDRDIQTWSANIPPSFKLSSPNDIPTTTTTTTTTRGSLTVRALMYLRDNHLRSLIARQHVLSASAIAANPHEAQHVMRLARASIRTIVALNAHSDVYARQHAAYNHFLVSALAIVLLGVSHAPGLFANAPCRDSFAEAVALVRGFSTTSVAGHRLWKSMCGLVAAVRRFGLGEGGQQQQEQTGLHAVQAGNREGGVSVNATVAAAPLGELFDPDIYSTHAHPDMTHVGLDLMGLFDAFGHHQQEGQQQEYQGGRDHGGLAQPEPFGEEGMVVPPHPGPPSARGDAEPLFDYSFFMGGEDGGDVDQISRNVTIPDSIEPLTVPPRPQTSAMTANDNSPKDCC